MARHDIKKYSIVFIISQHMGAWQANPEPHQSLYFNEQVTAAAAASATASDQPHGNDSAKQAASLVSSPPRLRTLMDFAAWVLSANTQSVHQRSSSSGGSSHANAAKLSQPGSMQAAGFLIAELPSLPEAVKRTQVSCLESSAN